VTAPPDLNLSATPTSRDVVAGAGATYTVGVASLNGFADDVALSLTGLPSGVGTASFSPQVVAGAGSSQLTVTTLPTAPGGTYPLTITGAAGDVTHTVAVTLVISARDFALSVSPSSVTIRRGQSAKYTLGVSVVGGSVGNVALTVAGLPTGTTAVFSPKPGRIARQFDTHGEDDVVDTARDLHAADHRDQRFPGSSGHGDAHRPVATSYGPLGQFPMSLDTGVSGVGRPACSGTAPPGAAGQWDGSRAGNSSARWRASAAGGAGGVERQACAYWPQPPLLSGEAAF
jgi:hypothetical protein